MHGLWSYFIEAAPECVLVPECSWILKAYLEGIYTGSKCTPYAAYVKWTKSYLSMPLSSNAMKVTICQTYSHTATYASIMLSYNSRIMRFKSPYGCSALFLRIKDGEWMKEGSDKLKFSFFIYSCRWKSEQHQYIMNQLSQVNPAWSDYRLVFCLGVWI